MSLGLTKIVMYPNLCHKVIDGDHLILVLYIDDLFLTKVEQLIVGCKRELASMFGIKDLGLMNYFLGLEVWKRSYEVFLSKGKYTFDILSRLDMLDYKSMVTSMVKNMKMLGDNTLDLDLLDPTMYRQVIESLIYLVNTSPYI